MAQQVFRRTEVKYVLSPAVHRQLMERIDRHLKPDRYFKGTNCSIYFDTDARYLAIHSMESPLFKEKVRLRSYGVPKASDTVFLEVKRKYNGVGSKRRTAIRLDDFYKFSDHQTKKLACDNQQIGMELEELFARYELKPALFLAYDRQSYVGKDDPSFRVTFDRNVRSRLDKLRLDVGDQGESYFKHQEIVMEVKALDRYPGWFVKALSDLKIYPAKFSKYGRVTERLINDQRIQIK